MADGKFWFSIIISPIITVIICLLSVSVLGQYGVVLFIGSPILMGTISTVLYSAAEEQPWGRCIWLGQLSLLFTAIILILIAFEGVVCIVMAIPLAVPLNMIGVVLGKLISKLIEDARAKNYLALFLVMSMPFLLGFEASTRSRPTIHQVVSTVEIDAPIEKVWKTVVAFPQIEKEPEGILRLGFAYPVNAQIDGSGVGATRYCNFNTGPFVEPITVWDEPHLLAFDVKEQPAPMIETSPYAELHAPHLEYLRSEKGQFRLYEKDGKTVVEGTTFYTHDIAPDIYWRYFSDEIIHRIHMRVLNHIKEVAEK